jgi:2-methylcitrate dehydratase PrpD
VTLAAELAGWAAGLEPTADDEQLAHAALTDTLAVRTAAGGGRAGLLEALGAPGRFAALAHVLDFDDLHVPSTTHVSAVCVPAALARGGGAREYLGGAGVMARLGTALGWSHYTRGWHATCTAGAPAAAVAAGLALGLDAAGLATAIALAVPAAGGVQAAFGTDAKALQVGFAVDAGVRAADLAAAGATADPRALEQWMALVGAGSATVDLGGPAIPGGLAVKLFPCCYALQRPIQAARALRRELGGDVPDLVRVRTPRGTVQPLIHATPRTGLEGKFSLEYGVAAALADPELSFATFEDAAVREGGRLPRVEVELTDGGDGLLDGEVAVAAAGHEVRRAGVEVTDADLAAKARMCGAEPDPTWERAAAALRA